MSQAGKTSIGPFNIASLYADLGDKDSAFEWLNTAHIEHDAALADIRVRPQFDSLRSDPRYAELLRKMGFLPK